jgi:muconolactone delta-isomerase
LIEAESQQVRAMFAEGVLRAIWRRQDMPGASILFEAGSEAEVRGHMATLPLAQRGMLEIVVVTGLAPYPGFGPR